MNFESFSPMAIPWQDFFRPDPQSSNRNLKKYLQGEGLNLGHRDLVLLRQYSEQSIYFSYAALESWSDGELSKAQLEELLPLCQQESGHDDLLQSMDLVSRVVEDGIRLIAIEGELDSLDSPDQGPTALVLHSNESSREDSPLLTVFGSGGSAQPGAGGVWDEDDLQAESVTLLDGESSKQLVEAFRHLFRAAPSGAARASVVAIALSRHRRELDLEVSQKLEEIAPPFGQAMRQLFEGSQSESERALQFLLESEDEKNPAPWSGFWSQIRPTILESLTRTEKGCQILTASVDFLSEAVSGEPFLNHHLLDAFLNRLDDLSPKQQETLMSLIVDWAQTWPEAVELLESRLNLTGEKNQRLLLGQCLRRIFESTEAEDSLVALASIFVDEAISEGSTAGALALADLLKSFEHRVLLHTSATHDLPKFTERQTLNILDIWEMMVAHDEAHLARVTELYRRALETASSSLSLILKSSLLERQPIFEAFTDWLRELQTDERRKVVAVGYTWSLTVLNRPIVARALSDVDWGFSEVWSSEWGRPHLSYQRLGWLAQCAPSQDVPFESDRASRLKEILLDPPSHLYFWDLLKQCTALPGFVEELGAQVLDSAEKLFKRTEANQEEEREALFEVASLVLSQDQGQGYRSSDWSSTFREGSPEEVWWLSGVLKDLYCSQRPAPEPTRDLVSALIHRLLSSGERSMQDLLSEALAAEDPETPSSVSRHLTLEVSNLAYECMAALAEHPSCSPLLQGTVRRRLTLFLISWAKALQTTTDPYAFRETPLFEIVESYLEDPNPQLQSLLKETSQTFLELHRKAADKFRLEVRAQAQQFFRAWADRYPETSEAKSWSRVLGTLVQSVELV